MKKLEKQQMETTVGGVPLEEYCRIAYEIIANNEVDGDTISIVNGICKVGW
ncbi:MAG: hypothetical protein AB7E36_17815 [Salinivirgaceae bacterium]